MGRKLQDELVSAGGKGINVSRALHRLGIMTKATGIIGGSAGRQISEILKKEGIPSDFLWVKEETRTNVTLKNTSAKSPKRVMGKGPKVDGNILDRFEAKLKGFLRGCSFVVLSGKNARGAPTDYYATLIALIKKAKTRTVLDSSSAPLRESLSAKPDIIKPNLEEAEAALGRKLTSFGKLKGAVKDFHHMGIRIALLTLAERGALGCFRGRIWHCRVPKVRGEHALGCGDAFLAGFLFASLRGYIFPDALRFAASCGTINYRAQIPGKIDKADVLALLNDITIKEVSS